MARSTANWDLLCRECKGCEELLELDVARLMRAFRGEDVLRFYLKGDFSDLPLDQEELEELIGWADDSVGPESPVRSSQWLQTTAGWSATLKHGGNFDAAVAWLQAFAELPIWTVVRDGVLTSGPGSQGSRLGFQPVTQTAFVAYGTKDLTEIPRDFRGPVWHVEESVTRHLAEQALAWTYRPGGHQYLARIVWQVELVGLANTTGLAQAIDEEGLTRISGELDSPDRVRRVNFLPHGLSIYHVIDPTQDWTVRVAELRKRLLLIPARTNLGFIRSYRGLTNSWPQSDLPPIYPHVEEVDVRYNVPLLASMTPDVHGLQLLTSAHLDRAHDLSRWTITNLGGGRHLVEASDLSQWYAADEPSPDVLAQARADFGEMIMTRERIAAESPWHD